MLAACGQVRSRVGLCQYVRVQTHFILGVCLWSYECTRTGESYEGNSIGAAELTIVTENGCDYYRQYKG